MLRRSADFIFDYQVAAIRFFAASMEGGPLSSSDGKRDQTPETEIGTKMLASRPA